MLIVASLKIHRVSHAINKMSKEVRNALKRKLERMEDKGVH
jgi:hypothetical protein